MIRAGLVLLLTLVIASIATIWFLPASLAWRVIEPTLSLPNDVSIALPRGSLRQGHTLIQFRGFPPTRLSWQADWPSWIETSLAISHSFRIEGPGHEISGNLKLLPGQDRLLIEQLSGEIQSRDINELAEAYGHQFSGFVTLKNGVVNLTAKCFNALEGDLSWSGGRVSLNGFNGLAHYQLPPLQARLDLEKCSAALDLTRADQHLARLVLGLDGWFSAELQPTLLVLAQVPGAERLLQPLLFEEKIL